MQFEMIDWTMQLIVKNLEQKNCFRTVRYVRDTCSCDIRTCLPVMALHEAMVDQHHYKIEANKALTAITVYTMYRYVVNKALNKICIIQYGSNCILGIMNVRGFQHHPKTSLTFLFNSLAILVRHTVCKSQKIFRSTLNPS